MKKNKWVFVIIGVVLLGILTLLFGGYLANELIKAKDEARLTEITLPQESRNLELYLDKVESTKLSWKDAVLIEGWTYNKNVQNDKRTLYLVLRSRNNSYVYLIDNNNVPRPDVTAGMHLDGTANNHGFKLKIPVYKFKDDTCSIGMVLEDETGKYFMMSNKAITISNGIVQMLNVDTEATPKSNQVALNLNKPTKTVKYYFDMYEQTDKRLNIVGWGFLEGLDASGLKSYILLKKEDRVLVYDGETALRKDITAGFANYGLNLDSTGFSFQISLRNLEPGSYQLGLYLAKGNEAGSIYSEKQIVIGKPQ